MLHFESYNQKQYAVRGDKNVYGRIIKELGGRWNTRMRGGEGWLVSKSQKSKLEELVNKSHDHTTQDKYHRERSRSPSHQEEEEDDDVKTEDGTEDVQDELEKFYKSFRRTPEEKKSYASPSVSGSSGSGNTYDDIEELFETMAFIADRLTKVEKKVEKMEKRQR